MSEVKIIRNLSFADYCKIDAVNASRLWPMRTSALLCKHQMDNPKPQSDAMLLGNVFHALVLELDMYDKTYQVGDFGKRGTAKYLKLVEEHPGRTLITWAMHDKAFAMADAVNNNKETAAELLGPGDREVTIVWRHDRTGLLLKARLDLLKPDRVVDLKSSRDIEEHKFEADSARLGYHFKAAYYAAAALEATGEPLPFSMAVCESAAPYDTAVYEVPTEALAIGEMQVEAALDEYKRCMETGIWLGKARGQRRTLHVPAWEIPEEMSELIFDD